MERLINVPLLRKTMEHIEHHPEHWYQGLWRTNIVPERLDVVREIQPQLECGTAMCFAGWACELAGETWLDPSGDGHNVVLGDGKRTSAGRRAQQLLGLSEYEADCLFDGVNDLDALKEIVGRLIERAER